MFPIVPILILTTIINSIVPSGPIFELLTPTRPHVIGPTNATRTTPATWGRTFVDYADGIFSAGISLDLPPLWTSKTPARRSVCISHGMRLTATPAQCMALVSYQLGIPPPTSLSLAAPRTFLALPASRRPVFLTLPPAPVRKSFLLLSAPKRVPVLALPAPKRLTLSGPPQPPPPALFLPALDDLYTFPFPTFVAHVVPPTWEAPADLLWSVRGARNIFAAQYVVDTRKTVTFLVMECLVGLTLMCWLLTCIDSGVIDLPQDFGCLVRCVWIGPPRSSFLATFGFENETSEAAEAAATQEEIPASEAAHPSAKRDHVDESKESLEDAPGSLKTLEGPTAEDIKEPPTPKDTPIELATTEAMPGSDNTSDQLEDITTIVNQPEESVNKYLESESTLENKLDSPAGDSDIDGTTKANDMIEDVPNAEDPPSTQVRGTSSSSPASIYGFALALSFMYALDPVSFERLQAGDSGSNGSAGQRASDSMSQGRNLGSKLNGEGGGSSGSGGSGSGDRGNGGGKKEQGNSSPGRSNKKRKGKGRR